MARPIKGEALVDGLQGSEQAKHRLKVILETLSGKKDIAAACEELGIGRSRFFALREQVLQGMVDNLEPKPKGRPPQAPDPQETEEELAALKARLDEELLEQRIANVREEIRLVFPHLAVGDGEDETAGSQEKKATQTRNQRKRQCRQQRKRPR